MGEEEEARLSPPPPPSQIVGRRCEHIKNDAAPPPPQEELLSTHTTLRCNACVRFVLHTASCMGKKNKSFYGAYTFYYLSLFTRLVALSI